MDDKARGNVLRRIAVSQGFIVYFDGLKVVFG